MRWFMRKNNRATSFVSLVCKRREHASLSCYWRPSYELIIGILQVRLPFKVLGFSANVFKSPPINAALSVCRVIVITMLIIFHLDCNWKGGFIEVFAVAETLLTGKTRKQVVFQYWVVMKMRQNIIVLRNVTHVCKWTICLKFCSLLWRNPDGLFLLFLTRGFLAHLKITRSSLY